jgi:hypothetical protein
MSLSTNEFDLYVFMISRELGIMELFTVGFVEFGSRNILIENNDSSALLFNS